MTSLTTVLNVTIGESKCVPRIWMEGESLCQAGLKIDTLYYMKSSTKHRIELHEAESGYTGQTFKVSSRTRHGIRRPLMEVRTRLLKEVFEQCAKVRVAIRRGVILITAIQRELNIIERCQRILQKLRAKQPLELCSLFHAGGVMDKAIHHGLALGGLQSYVKIAVEMSKVYLSASLRNNPELWGPDSIAIQSDIRDLNWNNQTPACDVLIAGIPCNAASASGKTKNELEFAEEHEDVGSLFIDFLNGVEATNAAIVVVENVPEYQKTAGMAAIRSRLKSLGYNIYEAVLDGNDFGALEKRRRMVMIAVCKGLSVEFNFSDLKTLKTKESALSEVLEYFPHDSDRWDLFEHLKAKWIRDKANGKGFAPQHLSGEEGYCGTIGKGYFKGRSTEPFITHPSTPELLRLLTAEEHARVKGVPCSIIAGEAETVAHEILGQAVIYPKFMALAVGIAQMLKTAFAKRFVPLALVA